MGFKTVQMVVPRKTQIVGRDEWIKRVVESTIYFPKRGINPNFVIGVEMAKPYGFRGVRDALKSTLEGFEYIMTHDVVPRMDFWAVEPGSELCVLAKQESPPTEYFIEVERQWLELLKKYGHSPPLAISYGCSLIDTEFDWYRYH